MSRTWKLPFAAKSAGLVAIMLIALLATPGVASAATDDSFSVFTTDSGGCGYAAYTDYGAGNDDYIVIRDRGCTDYKVVVWAWIGSTLLGSKSINGNGTSAVWDPFPGGNVVARDNVGLKVCIYWVPNPAASTGNCRSASHVSVDG